MWSKKRKTVTETKGEELFRKETVIECELHLKAQGEKNKTDGLELYAHHW